MSFLLFLSRSLSTLSLSPPSPKQSPATQDGALVQFKTKKTTQLKKLMKAYCERMNRESGKSGEKREVLTPPPFRRPPLFWGFEGRRSLSVAVRFALGPKLLCLQACRRGIIENNSERHSVAMFSLKKETRHSIGDQPLSTHALTSTSTSTFFLLQ